MLRIIQSSSAARAKSYFTMADYYSEGQELVGRWRGQGAARLGLSGVIEKRAWDRLCDNERPDTGKPLTVRRRHERRVGYDFNFHAPKSVSLLFGATQDARIVTAFREAVESTMQQIECDAKCRVRTHGKNNDRGTGNLVWGEYVHFTSRPVGGVPDPHLHAHCFVFNATFDAEEGRWKAAQFGDIKRDGRYFEALFHSTLARTLEDHGLATVRTKSGWELDGFRRPTLDRFSRRTAQIEAEARRRGIVDPAAKAELGAVTREKKANQLSMRQLRELWRDRMTPDELTAIDAVSGRFGTQRLPEDHMAARDAVSRAITHCFERASVVPQRTLIAESLRQSVGKASAMTVAEKIRDQPVIHANRDGRSFVTTREVLAEEGRMLAFARNGRGTCRPINPEHRFRREWLGQEQRAAVRHVLASRDRVILVRGAAGTGKTSIMQEAREAIEQTGTRVFAFAPSAVASRDVLRKEGFASADTVTRLLVDAKLQDHICGSVVWIDEAGLIGTKTMSQLFDLAERTGARIVLSGDVRQHGSVERGAALRQLEEEAGLKPAAIKEIQRQKAQYKAAVADLSEGKAEAGFRRLDRLGWIRELPDGERYDAISAAYVEALSSGKTALVVSPTHAEGDRVTSAIRDRMRADNLLGSDQHAFIRLTPRNLTLGQRQDATSYEPGDVVLFHQNAKGHHKGDRLIVGRTPIPLDQAERFSLYRPEPISLAVGDRIRITKNGSTVDGAHRLNNGDLFTLGGFTPSGDLLLANGWAVSADYGHLCHGFVITSHASQGKTVDRVLISQSAASFRASSQEQFYVSVSRGRDQALVFTDDKTELLRAVTDSDERISGTELVAGLNRDRTPQCSVMTRAVPVPGIMPHRDPEVEHER